MASGPDAGVRNAPLRRPADELVHLAYVYANAYAHTNAYANANTNANANAYICADAYAS